MGLVASPSFLAGRQPIRDCAFAATSGTSVHLDCSLPCADDLALSKNAKSLTGYIDAYESCGLHDRHRAAVGGVITSAKLQKNTGVKLQTSA